MRIGIIAALPEELKPLVRGWEQKTLKDGTRVWTRRAANGDAWVAACSGMGAEAARRAFVGAEAGGALDRVLSVGWAGALGSEVQSGEARVVSTVIDALTGERVELGQHVSGPAVVTGERVADATEKARLRATYPAAVMVDMEAATVARLAAMRDIPMVCIKGISDGVGAELPDLNPFIGSSGRLRLLPFLAHQAVRPRYWKAIAELNRNSAKAARAMCDLILESLEERNVDQLNRTGSP